MAERAPLPLPTITMQTDSYAMNGVGKSEGEGTWMGEWRYKEDRGVATHRLTEALVASALLHRDSHRLVMAEAPPAMTYSKKTMMNTR